jgi:uncharacterized OsmC-like protein
MDAAELRHRQAPLRDRYRSDPTTAQTELSADSDFRDEGITCTVETWSGPVRAGLHTATGGDGSDACSGDMLLEALAACAGVTLRSVVTAEVDADLEDTQLERLARSTERYCVVSQSLSEPARFVLRRVSGP